MSPFSARQVFYWLSWCAVPCVAEPTDVKVKVKDYKEDGKTKSPMYLKVSFYEPSLLTSKKDYVKELPSNEEELGALVCEFLKPVENVIKKVVDLERGDGHRYVENIRIEWLIVSWSPIRSTAG